MNYVFLYFVDLLRTMLFTWILFNKITSKFEQQNDATQTKGANLHYDYPRSTANIEIKFVVSSYFKTEIYFIFRSKSPFYSPQKIFLK